MSRVPLVTVSIPAWRCGDTIREAVLSVLDGTVDDIQVIVTNDGDDPNMLDVLGDIAECDSRLVVRRVPSNVGRYAIDHDIVQRCKSRWFTVCDADDWVEHDWLESLLRTADNHDVVIAPHWTHDFGGGERVVGLREFTGEFGWWAHMGACLWSVDWLKRVGATQPFLRVGWDNMMTGMAFLCGDHVTIDEATYHRVRREHSLTTAPQTGMRSPLRVETQRIMRDAWADMVADPTATACVTASIDMDRRLVRSGDVMRTDDWSMTGAALAELEAYLFRWQPRNIVEFGSGLSTVVLANYARVTGAQVTTLEHDQRFLRRSERLLGSYGVQGCVNLVCAPLEGVPPVYRASTGQDVDFVVIDAPPERLGGRAGTLPFVLPSLADKWVAWLDDGDRDGEREAVKVWRKEHKIQARQTLIPRGVTLLSNKQMRRHKVDASGVVVALLTGWRPDLLADTLGSLPNGFLESAHVVVCHDGGDNETRQVLDRYRDQIDVLHTKTHTNKQMDTIGVNWSDLVADAAQYGDYVLMLEDDWRYITEDNEWLTHAVDLLDDDTIGQVRLRHISDRVRNKHMFTGDPIQWVSHRYGLVSDAHFTFNPSLIRSADVSKVFPCDGELHAQQNAMVNRLGCVAQLIPAVFTHIGDNERSLRSQLHPPH